jgi:hypothetical protein
MILGSERLEFDTSLRRVAPGDFLFVHAAAHGGVCGDHADFAVFLRRAQRFRARLDDADEPDAAFEPVEVGRYRIARQQMTLTCRASRNEIICSRMRRSLRAFGCRRASACESPMYMMDSPGSSLRACASAVSPPTPLSIIPTGSVLSINSSRMMVFFPMV